VIAKKKREFLEMKELTLCLWGTGVYSSHPSKTGEGLISHSHWRKNMLQRLLICGLVFAVCTAGTRADDPAAKKAPPAPNAAFERLKKLAGSWVMTDKDGKPTDQVYSVIKMTSGGSAIHETIFPGQPTEMVSVYTVEGGDLFMTHYCMLGNQPKMKADPKSPANQICFKFAGGTNINVAKDMHMHEGTLTFIDDDHIEFAGVCWAEGKACPEHACNMKLVRKK
jgi:hypothetical protein